MRIDPDVKKADTRRRAGRPGLDECAERITSHLKRFEADAGINVAQKTGSLTLKPYNMPSAQRRGTRLRIRYADPLGQGTPLTANETREYLAWLDAGNVGKHWESQKEES